MSTKNTAAISLPKSKIVRGYEVKRLALGGYLQAMERVQEFPARLMDACFPGDDLHAIIDKVKRLDAALLERALSGVLLTAPEMMIRLTAALTGIDERTLKDDLDVGADGLVEILTAWVEVNKLGDFTRAARKLLASLWAADRNLWKPSIGSKG